jgi:hypothetical protein
MKFELKPLSVAAVPSALKRAEHYRLLNEPMHAESICRDILAVDPDNQQALITLVLALTDQFGSDRSRADDARQLLEQVNDKYAQAYYSGLVCERRGTSQLLRHRHGSGTIAYDWLRQAMDWYEKAEALRPAGNDDSILRWNTCARLIMDNASVKPHEDNSEPPGLE